MKQKAEALGLDLVTASMSANFRTMDSMYETERERRQALEVHIERVLDMFAAAQFGTVREYEACVATLYRYPIAGDECRKLAASHHENGAS